MARCSLHGDISGWNQYIAVTNRSTGIHFTSDWRGKLIRFHCFSCKRMGLYCTSDWRGKPIRFHCFSYKIVGLVHFAGSSGIKRTNICVPMLSLPLFDNDCESSIIMWLFHVLRWRGGVEPTGGCDRSHRQKRLRPTDINWKSTVAQRSCVSVP